jgi:predicted membrane protein
LAFPIAKLLLGKDIAAFYFILPFLISTIGGSIIGYVILKILEKNYVLKKMDV